MLPEPVVEEIHEGLLANDVVGFHTQRWRRIFLACCEELGLDASRTRVTAHPISVDVGEFESLAVSEPVLARERELVAGRPERIILRVDRTDPSKNVVLGLAAFGVLLDRRPDLRGRVRMLALLDPSRQTIPEYVTYRAAIEHEAAALEARHPGSLHLRLGDDFAGSVAAYKQFDVLLVNSIADGLNLVSKEAPLVNLRDGVVVLSANAGAYEELQDWVLPVDPFDLEGHVEALEQALELTEDERRARAAAIRAHVRTHDLGAWAEAELGELDRVSRIGA